MTTRSTDNPLLDYFRQPAIYLQLPSRGKFWPEGSIDLPESGEIPVFPMTAKDEIILKTPDALMNGEGVISVIHSCIPNIKNAWQIPVCDLDSLLIAIRLASYNNEMDITSTCTKCSEKNENVVDLSQLLDQHPAPAYPDKIHGQLTLSFKPQNFQSLNLANQASFEQQSLLSSIASSSLTDEQKQVEFKKLLPKITELTVQSIIDGINSITVNSKTVSDPKHIREFIDNCDRNTYEFIKTSIESIAKENRLQPFDIECANCSEHYQTTINFENSNFFV